MAQKGPRQVLLSGYVRHRQRKLESGPISQGCQPREERDGLWLYRTSLSYCP